MNPTMATDLHKALRALALSAVLTLPFAAHASGSWAVPRFTPTWAELERDLKALGFKAPPKKLAKKPPVKKPPVAVADGSGKPEGTGPVEGGVKPGEGTGTDGQGTEGGAVAGTSQPGGQCKCPEPPPVPVQVRCPVNEAAEPGAVKPAVGEKPGDKKKPKDAPQKKLQRKKYWWQDE